ncbi:MAG: leucine-rich repeat domain-containing protein [Polyangiales bacterium]
MVHRAARSSLGKPDPKARPLADVPGSPGGQLLVRSIAKDVGAGWFDRGFVYLFGEEVARLSACLDAWKWLLPEHGRRAVLGHNAYGALLVLETSEGLPVVRILDPVLLTYYAPIRDLLPSFVESRLAKRDLTFFCQRGLHDAWRARTKKRLLDGQMLPVRMPKAEGGLRDANALEPVDIVAHYRATSKAFAREAEVPQRRLSREPQRFDAPDVLSHLEGGALPEALTKALRARSKVTALDLKNLGLATLPEELFRLKDLWQLSLAGNRLQTLPDQIAELRKLGHLDLSGNELAELPEAIGALSSLTWLGVSQNRLRALPAAIGKLRALKYLFAEGNQIASLPDMKRMTALREVVLRDNRLRSIPPALARSGVKIDARDNVGLRSTAGVRVRSTESTLDRMVSGRAFAEVGDRNLRFAMVQSLVDEKRIPFEPGADLEPTRIGAALLARLSTLRWSSTSSLLFAIDENWNGESEEYRIDSFDGIGVCKSLRSVVMFYESWATDLRPLASLGRLEEISIVGGPLADLRPLAKVPTLRALDVSSTQVSEIAPLAKLPALVKLDLGGCPVEDASPLLACAALQEVKLRGVAIDRALGSALKIRGVRVITR